MTYAKNLRESGISSTPWVPLVDNTSRKGKSITWKNISGNEAEHIWIWSIMEDLVIYTKFWSSLLAYIQVSFKYTIKEVLNSRG